MSINPHIRRAEACEFLRRCQTALEVAQQVGDAEWKLEGLEEAVTDAQAAIEDWTALIERNLSQT